MSYFEKYLKYKTKYLNLRNKVGGRVDLTEALDQNKDGVVDRNEYRGVMSEEYNLSKNQRIQDEIAGFFQEYDRNNNKSLEGNEINILADDMVAIRPEIVNPKEFPHIINRGSQIRVKNNNFMLWISEQPARNYSSDSQLDDNTLISFYDFMRNLVYEKGINVYINFNDTRRKKDEKNVFLYLCKLNKISCMYQEFLVEDGAIHPTSTLTSFLKYLSSESVDNKRILMHCTAGHGRSGIFLLCLLFFINPNASIREISEKFVNYYNITAGHEVFGQAFLTGNQGLNVLLERLNNIKNACNNLGVNIKLDLSNGSQDMKDISYIYDYAMFEKNSFDKNFWSKSGSSQSNQMQSSNTKQQKYNGECEQIQDGKQYQKCCDGFPNDATYDECMSYY